MERVIVVVFNFVVARSKRFLKKKHSPPIYITYEKQQLAGGDTKRKILDIHMIIIFILIKLHEYMQQR